MRRVASLDGLRALAVLPVLATHSFSALPIGGVGVSVFFVLSGYLITSLLLRERDDTGRIALGLFYLRRAARLYPALLAMLAVTVALGGGVGPALIAGTYTTNLFNSFGIGNAPYAHTWSLAMEEQFYLVWPFLLPVVLRHGRRAWAWLAGLAVLSAGAGWVLGALTDGTAGVHTFNPVFRAHGLIVGCLVALYLHARPAPLRRPGLLVTSGLAVVAVSVAVALIPGHPIALGWNAVTPVIGGALLIAGLVSGGAPGIGRVFAAAPAVWLGTRSYAIYLWHVPLIALGEARGWPQWLAALVGVPTAIIVSGVSYRWVERPFLRLKARLHPRPTPDDAQTAPASRIRATSVPV
jgi:peptidoglycan/LPS O-acetylase OafA/YrhL